MRRRLEVLKLLTWYKGLQEEQAKIRVISCRTNLEKLLQEKDTIISLKKNCYTFIEKKRNLSSEELKYVLFQAERSSEFEKIIERKIEMQKKELKTLLDNLEKAYKERKLMETSKNKVQQLWDLENIKKSYRELDDLILLRRGREYA
jgi:predicted transposase YbfD/YdcC